MIPVTPPSRHGTAPGPIPGRRRVDVRRRAGRPCTALLIAAAGAWLLGGCTFLQSRTPAPTDAAEGATPPVAAPPAVAEPPDPVAEPAMPALSAAEAAEIEDLLRQADRAIAIDHLTYPSTGSALALYDRVRLLDPDNEGARRGLERIVERYLELAISAAERRRFSDARALLDRAYIVDADHPGIGPTRAQIELLDDARRQVIELDPEGLRNRDPALEEVLRQAGAASRGDGCRAEITARNDSEGRWIYQQMSAGGGLQRIQADLTIGTPARIEVLCFSR